VQRGVGHRLHCLSTLAHSQNPLQGLGISLFSPMHLSKLLQTVLPAHWFLAGPHIEMGNLRHSTHRPSSSAAPFGRPRGIGFLGSLPGRSVHTSSDCLMTVPWDKGGREGSPSPLWLQNIWELVSGLVSAGMVCSSRSTHNQKTIWLMKVPFNITPLCAFSARTWGAEEDVSLADLDGWPLIPVNDGKDLASVAYKDLIFFPPPSYVSSGDGYDKWVGGMQMQCAMLMQMHVMVQLCSY